MSSHPEDVLSILRLVAPGTTLREGLERIIKGGKGAIVVLGYSDEVEDTRSGGFKMSARLTAQHLSEVAKMDGAIILDDDYSTILYANVHLVPDPSIPTLETGTRHRTSERVARQTGKPVISVSESMQIVSLYVGDTKHVLEEISSILFRANQALATLERYRNRLDEVSGALSALEIENVVTLRDVLRVLEMAERVRRVASEIEYAIVELGTDGRLLRLQLDELMQGVENERLQVIRDYYDRKRKLGKVLDSLESLSMSELLEPAKLAKALGFDVSRGVEERALVPRGLRLLARIPRLPPSVVDGLVERFGTLDTLMGAQLEDLVAVDGVGEARARAIQEGLARLAESSILDRFA